MARAAQVWEPPVFLGSPETNEECIVKEIAFGRDPQELGPRMRAMLRLWPVGELANDGTGCYLEVPFGVDLDSQTVWDAAWANRDLSFTLNVAATTDHRFVVDREDSAHVFSEALSYPGWSPWRIVYKRVDGPHWSDQSLGVPVSPLVCQDRTPRVFLEEDPTGSISTDWLHVIFSINPGHTCPSGSHAAWLGYNRRELGSLDDVWEGTSFVSDRFLHGGAQGVQIRVDASGYVHFFGEEDVNGLRHFVHVKGQPPGPGSEWTLPSSWDLIDVYDQPTPPFVDPGDEPAVAASQGLGPWVIAWEHLENGVNETYVTVYDPVTDTFTTPYAVSPVDGVPSPFPVVAVSGSHTHLLYHEGNVGGFGDGGEGSARIWHSLSTDPADPASWSAPTELTAERAVAAKRPTMVADADTAYVGYQDYNPTREAWEAKLRRGYPVDDFVAADTHETWSGTVVLGADFQVAPTGTLSVEPGTWVVTAFADTANVGNRPNEIEIVVDGTMLVAGESTTPVRFTSQVEAAGSWGGVLFRDDPLDQNLSSIAHAKFEYPVFAIQVDSLAGTLFHNKFTDTELGDVYLDRDSRLPFGEEWVLDGGTDVRFEAGADQSGGGEVSDRIEFTVEGTLRTSGSTAGGDSVRFQPTIADDFYGDDWYGIIVRGTGWADGHGVADLDYTEISHARYPLSLFLADSATVRRTYVHHYNEEAITDWASDALIEECDIERGPNVSPNLADLVGRVGIHAVETVATIQDNRVFAQWERGIWTDFNPGYCDAPTQTVPPETTRVFGNAVVGAVAGATSSRGISVTWACREHDVEVLDNTVTGWNEGDKGGISLVQSSDITLDCNCVRGNGVGIFHRRDDGSLGVDFENGHSLATRNFMFQNFTSNVYAWKKGPDDTTPHTSGLDIGGGSESSGNLLQLEVVGTKNYKLDASEWNRIDRAAANAWRDQDGQPLVSTSAINAKNSFDDSLEQSIDVDVAIASTSFVPSCIDTLSAGPCPVPSPPSVGQGSVRARPTSVAPEGRSEETTPAPLPTASTGRWFLRHFSPNPTRGRSVPIAYEANGGNGERVGVSIFDVTGRKIRELTGDGRVGEHRVTWDLCDERGSGVGAGIYFVRLAGGPYRATRRIVVLR